MRGSGSPTRSTAGSPRRSRRATSSFARRRSRARSTSWRSSAEQPALPGASGARPAPLAGLVRAGRAGRLARGPGFLPAGRPDHPPGRLLDEPRRAVAAHPAGGPGLVPGGRRAPVLPGQASPPAMALRPEADQGVADHRLGGPRLRAHFRFRARLYRDPGRNGVERGRAGRQRGHPGNPGRAGGHRGCAVVGGALLPGVLLPRPAHANAGLGSGADRRSRVRLAPLRGDPHRHHPARDRGLRPRSVPPLRAHRLAVRGDLRPRRLQHRRLARGGARAGDRDRRLRGHGLPGGAAPVPRCAGRDPDVSRRPGALALLLHSHMPYVEGFGSWPFGEEWLWEAVATVYVPLLDVIDGQPVTLGLTPVLCDQLEAMRGEAGERYTAFLSDIRAPIHEEDSAGLEAGDEPELAAEVRRAAADYAFAERALDLVGAFAGLAGVELWTSAATHAVLPLLATDAGLRLQVGTGVAAHERRFGYFGGGLWLPECAYEPGLERDLHEHGVRAFCVDQTAHYPRGAHEHLE